MGRVRKGDGLNSYYEMQFTYIKTQYHAAVKGLMGSSFVGFGLLFLTLIPKSLGGVDEAISNAKTQMPNQIPMLQCQDFEYRQKS
jgi:hypothetical protein